MRVRFLTVQEVMEIQQSVVNEHGGAPGLRDASMLDSAVHTPQATYAGAFLHLGIFDMAAAYLVHIACNHPFVDGNKRTAWIATRVFLRLNGYQLKPRQKDVVDLMLRVANGEQWDWREIGVWLASKSKLL